MTRPLLEIRIEKRFTGLTLKAAFEAQSGRVALFGPSGAGKTTILKTIAGLSRPDKGRIRVGEDLWDDTAERIHIPTHQRGAAFVFQDDRLFPHISVQKNLRYGIHQDNPIRESQLVEMTGIGALLSRSVHTLSGGERKRVAIARALAASPRLLLLDEPYAGLDRTTARHLRSDLRRLLGETGVPHILVSHHLDDVLAHADEVALIDRGALLGFGAPEEVFGTSHGQQLIGNADDTAPSGPITILKAAQAKTSSVPDLEAWALANGRHLLLGADSGGNDQAFIRIRGSDVSLSLSPPGKTSVLNVLPATVAGLQNTGGFVDARLDLGSGVFLTARITSYSASALELAPGQSVYAMIKSAALTY